ncbi:MAG: TetR/AcrR family transcriptional regulator C-terminal domain-containing protein [Stackebrandtia sp.]
MSAKAEHTDPARRLGLLWGDRHRPGRRGRHELSVARIVAAGTALADASGVAALSMRKVAESLGVGTMSLYTYVPAKTDLVEVMVDTVYAEIAEAAGESGGDWRSRLTGVATASYRAHLAHPWLAELPGNRTVLGPGAAAKYERELAAVDGIGLSDVEMDGVVALIGGLVESAARRVGESASAQTESGMSENQWWLAHAPLLEAFTNREHFPLAARVGAAAGQTHGGAYAADGGFGFGLARILDGVTLLIDSRS